MPAVMDGNVVSSGMADRSESAGGGFAAPRVRPENRRLGVGSALLQALAEHCTSLGLRLGYLTGHSSMTVSRPLTLVS